MTEPETLPYDKCLDLLRKSIVGRVGFAVGDGLKIIPVNYVVIGDAVVVRTRPDSELGRHAAGAALAFQIDHFDYADHKGWSVLAVGTGELVEDVSELADQSDFWDPKPWADDEPRVSYVRLPWTELTGRRLGRGWTWENEMPVRRFLG
ncbi:MAG TPA: pyridoxamine 5'-phosphate oxidase family protein [Aeromicrobium sp.]|nr:pyridoxamine 5'-phosphate oxidase family protein [Aeromicrobium sp.]